MCFKAKRLLQRTLGPVLMLMSVLSTNAWAEGAAKVNQVNMSPGVTEVGQSIFSLHMTILGICTVIGIGVFGVMRQLVNERQPELGIRLALGASSQSLGRLVVRDCLIRVGVGAVLAVAGVCLGVRTGFPGLLSVSVVDPWLWFSIIAVLAATASAACYVPARRAGRIDPIESLRSE